MSDVHLLGWLVNDNSPAVLPKHARKDLVSTSEIDRLRPNLCYIERGLVVANGNSSMRMPQELVETILSKGGCVIQSDIDVDIARSLKAGYQGLRPLMGSMLNYSGQMASSPTSLYDRKEVNWLQGGGGRQFRCRPENMEVEPWLRPALNGVDSLAISMAVDQTLHSSDPAASGNRDSCVALVDDVFEGPAFGYFAAVNEWGSGHFVTISANFSHDYLTAESDNAQWIGQLAQLLLSESMRTRLVHSSILRSEMCVFLSHRSSQKPLVSQIDHELRQKGVATWLDVNDMKPGHSLVHSISTGLGNMTHFILFWSSDCVDAPWVQREIASAVTRMINDGIIVIPVKLDDTAIPTIISDLLYVDAEGRKPAEVAEQIRLAVTR